MRRATPEIRPAWKRLNVRKNRRTRRREAADALEDGIEKRGEVSAEIERYGTQETDHHPAEADDDKCAAGVLFRLHLPISKQADDTIIALLCDDDDALATLHDMIAARNPHLILSRHLNEQDEEDAGKSQLPK